MHAQVMCLCMRVRGFAMRWWLRWRWRWWWVVDRGYTFNTIGFVFSQSYLMTKRSAIHSLRTVASPHRPRPTQPHPLLGLVGSLILSVSPTGTVIFLGNWKSLMAPECVADENGKLAGHFGEPNRPAN